MKYLWTDLPKPKNVFTVRSAVMRNLNTGEIVQHYSANTKIVVVQKCVTPDVTYYRTESAKHHFLNYAFEASAFGLPNKIAPSVHHKISPTGKRNLVTRTLSPVEKQTNKKKSSLPKDGEAESRKKSGWFSRFFRRKNG